MVHMTNDTQDNKNTQILAKMSYHFCEKLYTFDPIISILQRKITKEKNFTKYLKELKKNIRTFQISHGFNIFCIPNVT